MIDLPPLPDDVRALIDAERGAPIADAASRAVVRAKLGASIAAGAGGTAGGLAATLKLIAIVVGVTTAGVGAAHLARSEHAAPPAPEPRAIQADIAPRHATASMLAPAPVPPPAVITPIAPAAERTRVPAPVRIAAARTAPPPPMQPPTTTPDPAPPPSESTLIAAAWRADAAHDPARALRLIDEATNAFPAGSLAEERDALRIDALRALGSTDEARARARAFLARYPHSIHRGLVDAALQEESP